MYSVITNVAEKGRLVTAMDAHFWFEHKADAEMYDDSTLFLYGEEMKKVIEMLHFKRDGRIPQYLQEVEWLERKGECTFVNEDLDKRVDIVPVRRGLWFPSIFNPSFKLCASRIGSVKPDDIINLDRLNKFILRASGAC